MEQELSPEKLLEIIAENFLCVRRLPFKVVSVWTYSDGDENTLCSDTNVLREVVVKNLDLEYFQNTKPSVFSNETPEQRFDKWRKRFPYGQKLLKETKTVKKGGWWYVKRVANTNSTIIFSREGDKFFAPTLEGAVKLFLESKKQQ